MYTLLPALMVLILVFDCCQRPHWTLALDPFEPDAQISTPLPFITVQRPAATVSYQSNAEQSSTQSLKRNPTSEETKQKISSRKTAGYAMRSRFWDSQSSSSHIGLNQHCSESNQSIDNDQRSNVPSRRGVNLSQETKKKLSESMKKHYANPNAVHPHKGKAVSAETRAKISKSLKERFTERQHHRKGIHHSNQTKQKISESHWQRNAAKRQEMYDRKQDYSQSQQELMIAKANKRVDREAPDFPRRIQKRKETVALLKEHNSRAPRPLPDRQEIKSFGMDPFESTAQPSSLLGQASGQQHRPFVRNPSSSSLLTSSYHTEQYDREGVLSSVASNAPSSKRKSLSEETKQKISASLKELYARKARGPMAEATKRKISATLNAKKVGGPRTEKTEQTIPAPSKSKSARPPRSEESKQRTSAALKARYARNPMTEATKQKLSAAIKKTHPHKPLSAEAKKKMAASARSRGPHSEETKRKISKALSGRTLSAETTSRISNSLSERWTVQSESKQQGKRRLTHNLQSQREEAIAKANKYVDRELLHVQFKNNKQ